MYMWPVLISWRFVEIRTFSVILFIAVILMGYVLWRKGREEHYEEFPLFDTFLISVVVGFIVARIGFVALHFDQFGLNPIRWLALATQPGISFLGWTIGSGYTFFKLVKKQKWEVFEMLDFWTLAVSFGHILLWIGFFLDGSEYGLVTQLPIGMKFPGLVEPRLPIQLLAVVVTTGIFWFLSWAEYRYRRFTWYRHKRHSAQPGFLFAMWLIMTGLLQVGLSFLKAPDLVIAGAGVDVVVYTCVFISGLVMLLVRSGRLQLPSLRRK